MGFGPQLADLDGDGHAELLSGSWPGEIFVFPGKPGREFGEKFELKDRRGNTIKVGAGSGNASSVNAVDWDGDGDGDLLVGDIQGRIFFLPNEGTPDAYAFGTEQHLKAAGSPIVVEGGDSGPFAADWDGDGDLDLLVGLGNGKVVLYPNTSDATGGAPTLGAAVTLVPASKMDWNNPTAEAMPGVRTKLCVADWNGDGRLDLLVGDLTMIKPNRPAPTPEEKREQDRLSRERDKILEQYGALSQKLYGDGDPKSSKLTKDAREALQKQFEDTRARLIEITNKLPRETEPHGFVWLYLRKPADAPSAGGQR